MEAQQKAVLTVIDRLRPTLLDISHDIHHRPEQGNAEYYAVSRLVSFLKRVGFQVCVGVAGLPTAFVACAGDKEGPALGFVAEYDALPGIGHGCGHNLIAAAGVGAAVALRRVLPADEGKICVLGTPAEETTGGKIAMLRSGCFDGLDAVMMFHPGVDNALRCTSLALDALEVRFYGEEGHYALPGPGGRKGDALEALLRLFEWIRGWKAGLPLFSSIQGVIVEGGLVPNIRPAVVTARFYLRSVDENTLDKMNGEFREQAEETALATNTSVVIDAFEGRYLPFRTNETLAGVCAQSLQRLGMSCPSGPCISMGAMDLGNVSQVVPSIHPFLTQKGAPAAMHSPEFAQAAGGEWGDLLLIKAAKVLALTGLRLVNEKHICEMMRSEHDRK